MFSLLDSVCFLCLNAFDFIVNLPNIEILLVFSHFSPRLSGEPIAAFMGSLIILLSSLALHTIFLAVKHHTDVTFSFRDTSKRNELQVNFPLHVLVWYIGGRKRSMFYYDLWNIKYLSKFKWDDLTEEIGIDPF